MARSKMYHSNKKGEIVAITDDCFELLDKAEGIDTSEKPFKKEMEEWERLKGIPSTKTIKQLKLLES